MNIGKATRMRIAETCDEYICVPNEYQTDNITIFKDKAEAIVFYPHNEYLYRYFPETLLTADELADENLFKAKKRALHEDRNSYIYGVFVGVNGASEAPAKHEKFTSRQKFLEQARRCVKAYAFAAPPSLVLMKDISVQLNKTTTIDPQYALIRDGLKEARMVPITDIEIKPHQVYTGNLDTVYTAKTSIQPDAFWGWKPWEIMDNFMDISLVLPFAANEYTVERLYAEYSAVRNINYLKKKLIESNRTKKGFVIGTSTENIIRGNILRYSLPDKWIVHEHLNNEGPYIISAIPESLGLDMLSISRVFNILKNEGILCPANFDLCNAKIDKSTQIGGTWLVIAKSDKDNTVSVICSHCSLLKCIDIFEHTGYTITGLCNLSNRNKFSCTLFSDIDEHKEATGVDNVSFAVEDVISLYLSSFGYDLKDKDAIHLLSTTAAILSNTEKVTLTTHYKSYTSGEVITKPYSETVYFRSNRFFSKEIYRLIPNAKKDFFARNDAHAYGAVLALSIMRALRDIDSDLYGCVDSVLRYYRLMYSDESDIAVPNEKFSIDLETKL